MSFDPLAAQLQDSRRFLYIVIIKAKCYQLLHHWLGLTPTACYLAKDQGQPARDSHQMSLRQETSLP